jgi:tetratricopeptide (TPR) repeat protein
MPLRLGDREKYLELRRLKMVYGTDYYDLARFYWEEGNREQALAVAEEGLKNGQGQLLSDYARDTGDRERRLDLQFAQAIDPLTLDSYKTFEKICSPSEWKRFEPSIIARLESAWRQAGLKILMYRQEYEQAVAVLTKGKNPLHNFHFAIKLTRFRRKFFGSSAVVTKKQSHLDR